MRRILREWDVFLLIMAAGLLTGVITFLALSPEPAACRHAVSYLHVPMRSSAWLCAQP